MLSRQAKPARSPRAFLFTDERVDNDRLAKAVQALRPGDGVVFRHYGLEENARLVLFRKVRTTARRRGLLLLVAGPLPTRFADCDGRHGAQGRMGLRSMPVHDRCELDRAARARADMVFISPVYPTRSHDDARPLGPLGYRRLAMLARAARLAPHALGGMTRPRAMMLAGRLCTGFGAIDALSSRAETALHLDPQCTKRATTSR